MSKSTKMQHTNGQTIVRLICFAVRVRALQMNEWNEREGINILFGSNVYRITNIGGCH